MHNDHRITLKKRVKLFGLQMCRSLGLFHLVRESGWRSRRLLILAYHGFSLLDEHLWNPELFLPAAEFESRLASLKTGGYTVLPLGKALRQLYEGTLPEKSVAITIDDGNYDFYVKAFPLLQKHRLPATVYLTTYYCDRNLPLFNHICSYMLWKGRGRLVSALGLIDSISELDLRRPETRSRALKSLLVFSEENGLSAAEKDQLARKLARVLSLDYDEFLRLRLLQRMNPAEVTAIAAAGIDVQLHTHRHRTPRDQSLFREEMEENRSRIVDMTARNPSHFCYPSGVYRSEFIRWLTDMGIESATTCDPGLASAKIHPLLLPRILDGTDVSPIEFEGWASGLSACIKRDVRSVDAAN
jgi:peptidoglycan/xylan/chitin deacetylase (PgdA/CDA1 family)